MVATDERVARFVSERCGFALCPPYTCMGLEVDGEITIGLIFNCWEGAAIHVTAAGTGWRKYFLRAVGEYVFMQLGCERMTFTTEQEKVAQYVERLGGKREGVLRSQFGKGRDGIVIGILKDEYLGGILK